MIFQWDLEQYLPDWVGYAALVFLIMIPIWRSLLKGATVKRSWCWFCWRLTNEWWPFGFGCVYFWLLPFAGDYIYIDYRDRGIVG